MVWSPLAGGLLSGKFGPGANNREGRRANFDFPPVDKDRAWACVEVMREVGEARRLRRPRGAGLAPRQAARDERHHRRQACEQLDDNLAAVDLTLDAEEITRLDEVSALLREYPGWMLARQAADRRPADFEPKA